jgi:hypothetical protein
VQGALEFCVGFGLDLRCCLDLCGKSFGSVPPVPHRDNIPKLAQNGLAHFPQRIQNANLAVPSLARSLQLLRLLDR